METSKILCEKRWVAAGRSNNRMEQSMKKQEIRIKKKTVSRGSRAKTIEMESVLGIKMFNIVRQFDMAYIKFKSQWGELDGIPEEEAMVLRDDALNAVREFSDFMSRFSEQVDFKYYPPKGLGKRLLSKINLAKEMCCLADR